LIAAAIIAIKNCSVMGNIGGYLVARLAFPSSIFSRIHGRIMAMLFWTERGSTTDSNPI